jgi:hypothetical protein
MRLVVQARHGPGETDDEVLELAFEQWKTEAFLGTVGQYALPQFDLAPPEGAVL